MTSTAKSPTPNERAALRITEIAETTAGQRFRIIGYAEIPVEDIEAHPRNPRPLFHLGDDNPQLIKLGDSIRTQGQTSPALVYELHNEKAQPTGKYRLYQGERRWRACKIAGVKTLRCFIAAPPKDEAEEYDWLGTEDAFKQDWQPFFILHYAWQLAQKHDVDVVSTEIQTRTSLSMSDLRMADKIFRLEPEIQAIVAEYEEEMYSQRLNGTRRKGGRIAGHGVRTTEFPVQKAALVWDLFSALRDAVPTIVAEYSDVELQRILAVKASQSTLDDLGKLHGLIRQAGADAPPGLLTELAELLTNRKRKIIDTTRAAGVSESSRLNQFRSRAARLSTIAQGISKNINQIGSDPKELRAAQADALRVLADVGEMERALGSHINNVERNLD